MEKAITENLTLIIVAGAAAVGFIGWLMYRNLKDEEEMEANMNDPKRDLHKTDPENQM